MKHARSMKGSDQEFTSEWRLDYYVISFTLFSYYSLSLCSAEAPWGFPVVPTVDLHVPKYEFREEGWYFLD